MVGGIVAEGGRGRLVERKKKSARRYSDYVAKGRGDGVREKRGTK